MCQSGLVSESLMECNKEEAIRALQIAEKKMQNNDFTGALKIAKKAQQLFPELENISQLLTVCEVHCSALNKLGSEMNWYGILQVEQMVDVVTIKKQYRRLALLLHPDKNKFAGAEAAFKLIGEANRVLTDEAKRSTFDLKWRGVVRNAAPNSSLHQSNGNTSVQKDDRAAKNHQNIPHSIFTGWQQYQQAHLNTFWTCCPFCKVRYQYYKGFQDRMLNCQNCKKNFIGLNITQIVPPKSCQNKSPNQKKSQNRGPSRVFSQNYCGDPSSTKFQDKFTSSHAASEAGSAADFSGAPKMEEQDESHLDVEVGKKGVEMPKSDPVKSKESETSEFTRGKSGGKLVAESSESCGSGNADETGDVGHESVANPSRISGGDQCRRSSRQKRNVSYREVLSDDDNDFVSHPKKPKANNPSIASEENANNPSVDDRATKDDGSAAVDGHEKKVKQNPFVPSEENLPSKRSTMGEPKVKGKEAANSDDLDQNCRANDGPEVDANAMSCPEMIAYPDPEFHNFDKDKEEGCFAVNQVWAIYDTVDGMPRFYARIRKVFSSEFKLQISWFEPDPDDQGEIDWCSKELPVSCGKYHTDGTEETADRLMFSHQMYSTKGRGRGAYMVYPRKGETWALFQNWDICWFLNPEKHIPYQLEYVEVLSDFVQDSGIAVAYLTKVKGFVSLLQRSDQPEFKVPPKELYRFSHRIPSFRMTGEEREDVPKGSFEFDPASLPDSFFKPDDNRDAEKDNGSLKTETTGFCPNSLKNEEKPVMGIERIPASKKHEKTDSKGATPIPRRSPRKVISTNMDFDQTNASKSVSLDTTSCSGAKVQSSGKGQHSKSSRECPVASPFPSPVRKSSKVQCFDFSGNKSEEKFQLGQIWALYSDKDGLPRTYAQVKKIESDRDFQLHVALLEPSFSSKNMIQPVCCGTFRVKDGETKVLRRSSFSHCLMSAKHLGKNKYEIYPRKGEVWALYKNRNKGEGEFDMVEVLADFGLSTRVVVLTRVDGYESMFKAPRIQRSKTGVTDIPRPEAATRFSHQINAFQHTGEEDSRLLGHWELDPLSISGILVCLD